MKSTDKCRRCGDWYAYPHLCSKCKAYEMNRIHTEMSELIKSETSPTLKQLVSWHTAITECWKHGEKK